MNRLVVNDVTVPFVQEGSLVAAGVHFITGSPSPLKPVTTEWVPHHGSLQGSGLFSTKETGGLQSTRPLGSGLSEVDLDCDFKRGGVFWRAGADLETGLTAAVMLDLFEPLDGNIIFYNGGFQRLPIHWSLGGTLTNHRRYRFRIESYGDRHLFSILDPETGDTLAGPLSYRVSSLEEKGCFGIHVEEGRARVVGATLLPSPLRSWSPGNPRFQTFFMVASSTAHSVGTTGEK